MQTDPPLSKALWMDRFGARLMQLHPRMNALEAAGHAVAAHAASSRLEPEAVAELWSGQTPIGGPGAPEAAAEPELPLDRSADA